MRTQTGVTLIELMVAVTIVGILLTFALPAYQTNVMESRRSSANIKLMQAAQLQERWFIDNNTYTADVANLGGASITDHADGTGSSTYTMSVSNVAASTFTLTATPVSGGSQENDSTCATITLDQAGRKGPSVECWQ